MQITEIANDENYFVFTVKRDNRNNEHLVSITLLGIDEDGLIQPKSFCDCQAFVFRKMCSHVQSVCDYMVEKGMIPEQIKTEILARGKKSK